MADIDKSLAQAPQGLEELAMAQPDMSIEIENPDSVTLDDGSMEITIVPGKEVDDEFNANLAEDMDEGQLTQLSGDLVGEYDADINSRKDWLTTYVDGLELLGLKVEDRTEPWPGACNVYHPLMTEALVKFQAETMMETGVVIVLVHHFPKPKGKDDKPESVADMAYSGFGSSDLTNWAREVIDVSVPSTWRFDPRGHIAEAGF